ncbi:hypothetical protein B7R21_15585 [Subtercola boreus]|uniref:histidine kinase n=1 Tax=Subtercola boreus TaxID=120213 RepID=A0A3E0VCI7_9MICO|nr:HAMP domain-containing sensor histidine kinase [Subtercola boreus]RFA07602.1 hypothetical protein B7R21_15585 [Subtercola boreus]
MKRTGSPDSLRGAAIRLTLQFIALMAVVLVIVTGTVFAIVNVTVNESNQRSVVVASQLDSVQETPSGTYITVVQHGQVSSSQNIPDGLVDTAALTALAATASSAAANGGSYSAENGAANGGRDRGSDPTNDQQSQRTVNGQTYLINTSIHGDRVVQVAVNLSEGSEELARLAEALIIASLIALAVAALLSYLMARRAIRPLADALTLQRQFVADASHELRTPLTILSTRAQLLQRRERSDLPPDVSTAVDDMVRDSRALTGILDDLLIAADTRSDVPLTAVDLNESADAAIATLRDEAERRGITLARTGSTGSVMVNGATAALLRLHIALLTNALDHARSSVRVDISGERDVAVIRVIDDGPGFDPAIADRAFDRFAGTRRVSDSAAGAAPGNAHYGLGLALVAEIARRHGGSVGIGTAPSPAAESSDSATEPAEPAGATVIVRIPLASP